MKSLLVTLLGCALPCLPAQGETARDGSGPTTVRLVGQVVDWQGTPIAGAAVGLVPREEVVTSELLADPDTVTDEEGRFRLDHPLPKEGARRPALHVAKSGWASILQSVRLKKEGDEYHAETDMGDLVLAEGARLFGRVRNQQGNPIAGARVTATDAMSAARGLSGMSEALCVATTGKDGIFSLPCALPRAARVEVRAQGHHLRVVSPVSRLTPLEVTLEPSGIVFGRVLDPRGSGVETTVSVLHEHRYGTETLRTGPDGSFRFTIRQPGRFRLRATAPPDSGWKTTHSPILDGPRANLELVMEAADEEARGTMLAVRCVDEETGDEVEEFRAIALWDEYANQNANYREYRLDYYLGRRAVAAEDGVARLPGPGQNQPALGCVRVLAPGRAPATVPEIEWELPQDGEDADIELTVELVPESVVVGRVVDERTGEPIADAKVWARVKQDPQLGTYGSSSRPPDDAAVSGKDGSFRLPQLGKGTWEVLVRHVERPDIPPVEVELEQAGRKELLVELPEGAVVKGRLVGAKIKRGSKVYLQPLPSFEGGYYSGPRIYHGPNQVPEGAVEVEEDGAFHFRGVKLDSYMLMLLQPSPPRQGTQLRIEIEPFRVRRKGIDGRFDLGEDQPGTLRGRIELEGAEVPMDRLVVVARRHMENQQVFFSPFSIQYQGPMSFVEPSGEFAIPVTPGRYQLEVVDIATSIRLHSTTEAIEMKSSGTEMAAIGLDLVKLSVKLTTPAEDSNVIVDRVEVRCSPANATNPNVGVLMGGNDNYDTGAGVTLAADQTQFEVVVPPGDVLFLPRNSAGTLEVEPGQRRNQAPLGRGEVTVEAGKPQEVEIAVEPPDEPDPTLEGAEKAKADVDR